MDNSLARRAALSTTSLVVALTLAAPPSLGETLQYDTLPRDVKLLVDAGLDLEAAEAAAADGDGALLAKMIGMVTLHDIAIIAGALPFPTVSYAAEVTEYSVNLGLKALPPRLFAPESRTVNLADGDGAGYRVADDGCGIEFELLAPQAGYSNLFGIANIGDPYLDLRPVANKQRPDFYRFRNYQNTDDPGTRWGFLRAPRVYHANTGVGVEVASSSKVRRYNPATGALGIPFLPIDSLAESPQQVYLPIGNHNFEWIATTEIEVLGDIAVPGVMLAFNTLSELKNLYGGAKASKLAKQQGFGAGIADEALDPAGAKRLSDGILKFEDVWTKAFEARKASKPTAAQKIIRKIRENLREIIKDLVKGALKDILVDLGKAGINSLDGDTKYAIQSLFGNGVADLLEVVREVYLDRYPPVTTKDTASISIAISFILDTLDENTIAIIRRTLTTRGSGALKELLTIETAESSRLQSVSVLDSVPPTINLDPAPVIINAKDFGGTYITTSYARLLELAEAGSSDNCGRTPDLTLSSPNFLPLGTHQVTWTARDMGPNPANDGQDYAPEAVQNILVRDIDPPLLLAPPSKVILDMADVPLAEAGIGNAAAIDLVDVEPMVTHDAPATFPVNTRTSIEWKAEDGSGNVARSFQLISVKSSNTAPTANDTVASTLTSDPVDIRLTANDDDELDGRSDPLWFKIESQPRDGEFVAPLYPFFIDDYRTRPGDALGQDYDPTQNVVAYIRSKYCPTELSDEERITPKGFVHEATYVHVTDDGIRYVLDNFFECDTSSDELNVFRRFSEWGPRGEFRGQVQIGSSESEAPADDAFRIDRDGFLYYNTLISGSTESAKLRLNQCPLDLPYPTDSVPPSPGEAPRQDLSVAEHCNKQPFIGYTFRGGMTPNDELNPTSLAYSRIDSTNNIVYVVDGFSLLAFDISGSGSPVYIGELGPKNDQGAVLESWYGSISSLEVDSTGNLYANDVTHHRVHKIGSITRDDQGEWSLGEYVGWAGKCTGSGNNACSVDPAQPQLGYSRGYSCTFEADSCTVAANERAGSEQGQFNSPRYIAIDLNDVLYVADYENERIQRFSPDGTFAGEAASEPKAGRATFILGDMGKPASVAVNSSQFFVVERGTQLVHIFGTQPFFDVTDSEAWVTYVSDQDFPNPNNSGQDSFRFSVSDGLEESAPATVTVTVSRNFRPPEARDETITVEEDSSVEFTLTAHDPDGIIGKDFLGLDTLTYSLTSWPEHGALSGYGDSWSYEPHADFYGEDSLRFKVNDGLFDSNEATVTFDVSPVNDPPVLTVEAPERVALGFPTQLETVFTDDRIEAISTEVPDGFVDGYEGQIDWGDNVVETTGDFANDNGDVGMQGVIVVAPPTADNEGRTLGQHTFEQTGERTINTCVTDNQAESACSSIVVNVEPLVSTGIGGIFYTEPLPEDELTLQEIPDRTPFTFEILMSNGMPSIGPGLPAENVVLDLSLPGGIIVFDIEINTGSCASELQEVTCDIGTLDPGAEARLAINAAGSGTLIYDEDRDFMATLNTSSNALNSEIGMFATVTLIADTTDTDDDGMSNTFELTYGLRPFVNDAAIDGDNDGLSNIEEYENGTSPLVADTDGDGVADGEEVFAGMNPVFDDVAPELTIPADIQVNATGTLTSVPIGSASAVDFRDGPVEVVANTPGPFPSGPNVVSWIATDEAGNRAEAFQIVNVVPMVNFQVDQTVAEGEVAKVRVELIGTAVEYPVVVPYTLTGTASNPADHNGINGEAVIESGLSSDIEIGIFKDPVDEPDETIILTMAAPATNAIPGGITSHVITVSETNQPPQVTIDVEQQGRRTTTIVSSAGLIGMIADVRDDPAQDHSFDWSASDPALIDPITVNDPAYLLDPDGLMSGMYGMHVSVTDTGMAQAITNASSLLRVESEQLILLSSDDSDGDGVSDAVEGPDDADGDRIANYLDNVPNSNMLRLSLDGRMLETMTGLTLRLGPTAFAQGSALASIGEDDLAINVAYGFGSDVQDFEVTKLIPGGSVNVVIPLAIPISEGAGLLTFVDGQWREFIEDTNDGIASAPGANGACPPPGDAAYSPGLTLQYGCVQLTLSDGGPNDLDAVIDSVVRITGGVAVPVRASLASRPQETGSLAGAGEFVIARTRIHSDSGDAVINSLTLQANGDRDDTQIDNVILVHDTNRNSEWEDDDVVLSNGNFAADDGQLTMNLDSPLELPVGDTDLLVIYAFGDTQ